MRGLAISKASFNVLLLRTYHGLIVFLLESFLSFVKLFFIVTLHFIKIARYILLILAQYHRSVLKHLGIASAFVISHFQIP